MAISHKRRQAAARVEVLPACLACHDSGIVSNADGMIRDWIPDYDVSSEGSIIGGSDCAIICHCHAAYAVQGPDGTQQKGGFRSDTGEILQYHSELGKRYAGAELDKAAIAAIHKRRLDMFRQGLTAAPAGMELNPANVLKGMR